MPWPPLGRRPVTVIRRASVACAFHGSIGVTAEDTCHLCCSSGVTITPAASCQITAISSPPTSVLEHMFPRAVHLRCDGSADDV